MTPSDESADVPVLAGAIDIGSNELRLLIAQVYPDGHTEVLERARRPVRLGHDTFVTARLSEDTIATAMTVLRDYRRILETYDVQMVRAVATSAVREASNGEAFVDRVALTVGLDVEVIETTEESRLIVAAVRHAVEHELDLHRSSTLIAEVGGGSTLLIVLREGEIAASQSFDVGSIRMQEMLALAHQPPPHAAQLLRTHVDNTVQLARQALQVGSIRTFLAIGGDARFAAQQVGKPTGSGELHEVRGDEFDRLVEQCAMQTPEELSRRYKLAFAEAETLVPALLVYQGLLHSTSARKMLVSQVSMRDGLLLDLPRYVRRAEDPVLRQSIILSAKTIGEKYHYDAEHAEQVAAIAARLFDELHDEHGLTPHDRLLLQVAALLHDVGSFVAQRAHHKHSYYLITNAEILGLNRDDIATVALVARYHRRGIPKVAHVDYMALPRRQRMEVSRLAAIARVADALDQGHMRQVTGFEFEHNAGELVIYARGANATLERLALAEKSDLFQEIFGMRVRLEEEGKAVPEPGRPAAET